MTNSPDKATLIKIGSELEPEYDLLRESVRQAGKIALSYYGKTIQTERKSDGTEVSEADLAVDDFLKNQLNRSKQPIAWLSEETEDSTERLSTDLVWIIDPIDGTRAFLQGRDEWAISAALVWKGKPVIGVVYNPARDEFYEAKIGQGAKCNQILLNVSAKSELSGSRMISSKSIAKHKIWHTPLPEPEILWVNSMAYRLCLVASGHVDATISLSQKNDWDIAAAHLLVTEAGGAIQTSAGFEPCYNGKSTRHENVFSANPQILGLLAKNIRSD